MAFHSTASHTIPFLASQAMPSHTIPSPFLASHVLPSHSGSLSHGMFLYNPQQHSSTLPPRTNNHGNFSILKDTKQGQKDPTYGMTLEELLGPKRQELRKVIPMTFIYVVIFVTGVIGNVATCIVIANHRYMHTVTNFYLVNLAVSDLLLLILGLPLETFMFWSAYPWMFGEPFCVFRTLAAETSTNASILTITAFTVERYVAICHPMWIQTKCSLQRAARVITIIWAVSGLCSVPIGVQYGVVLYPDETGELSPESAMCNIVPSRSLEHSFEISSFIFFVAPMLVITALYARIAATIRRSTLTRTYTDLFGTQAGALGRTRAALDLRQQHQAVACRAVVKMLVVVAFLICWAPFHTQRLVSIYVPSSSSQSLNTASFNTSINDLTSPAANQHLSAINNNDKPDQSADNNLNSAQSEIVNSLMWSATIQTALYYISGILYYVSAVINPILYNIMSLKFRQSFKRTVLRPCACLGGQGRPGGNSSCTPGVRLMTSRLGVDAGPGSRRLQPSTVQTFRFCNRQTGMMLNNSVSV